MKAKIWDKRRDGKYQIWVLIRKKMSRKKTLYKARKRKM